MRQHRRVLSVVCLVLFLGLPLSAQTERGAGSRFGFLEMLWQRLTSPVTSIWEAVEGGGEAGGGTTTQGAGAWDPFG